MLMDTMKEIQQIIEEKIWERHEGCECKPDEFKEYPEKCCYVNCAKAIEQYVIKARIKELEKIYRNNSNFHTLNLHIAELKKELK